MIQDYDVVTLSRKEQILFGLCLLLACVVVSWTFYQNLILLLLFPLIFPKGKKLFTDYLIANRKKKLLLEFRDFLFSLSTSFATGRHMTEGLKEAESYLFEIHGEKGLLQGELQYMIKAIDETGASDLVVLSTFAERTKLEDIYLFTDVFRACRETGGDLVSSMHKAALMISDKIHLENEMKTMVSQKKLEGRMIAVMPFLMIFFLQWMSPGYLEVMYTTAGGRCLMTLALAMNLFAYLWMERMTNVEL